MNLVVRMGFTLLLVASASGCRSLRDRDSDFSRILNEPAPVPEDVRASFGVMGVVATASSPQIALEPPRNFGDIFGAVAAQMFVNFEEASREENSSPVEEAKSLMFVAAGAATAGLVAGAFNSVPESELQRGRAALTRAIRDDPLDWGTEAELLSQAKSRQLANFRPIPPLLVQQMQASGPTNLDLRVLAGQEFDSVLVLNVERCGFAAKAQGNPPLAFVALVNADVLQARDGAVLHTGTVIYHSRRLRFHHWVANDAKLFRAELVNARRLCAEVLLDQLFGTETRPKPSEVR